MKRALVTLFLFAWLLLALIAPYAAFAPFIIFILGAVFLWAFWSVVEALTNNTNPRKSHPNS